MSKHQLTETLQKIFHDENQRIVFWYDADKEFEDGLSDLNLDGVKVVLLNETGALEVKILLEMQDTVGKYLLYAPFAEPDVKDDWLLDIRLYSRTFHADQASIQLSELGLGNLSLRPYLAKRRKFFNKDRMNRLKKWVKSEDTETDLDLKMLAVLTKADLPETFSILMKLFGELCQPDDTQPLLVSQTAWDEIKKFDLTESFWEQVTLTFGYKENTPSLNDLLIRILVTDFAKSIKGAVPIALQHFVLSNKSLSLTASVFANHWRSNINHFSCYNQLSKTVSKQLKLENHLGDLDDQFIARNHDL